MHRELYLRRIQSALQNCHHLHSPLPYEIIVDVTNRPNTLRIEEDLRLNDGSFLLSIRDFVIYDDDLFALEHRFSYDFRTPERFIFRFDSHTDRVPWQSGCHVHVPDANGGDGAILEWTDARQYLWAVDVVAALEYAKDHVEGRDLPWEKT